MMGGAEQAQRFVGYGREVVAGMPAFVDGIGLGGYLRHGDGTHLNIVLNDALKSKLSGTSHGGADVDASKWAISNADFAPHISWLAKSGLWTASNTVVYPDFHELYADGSSEHNIGLDIPGLPEERVELSAGEESADTAIVVGALLDGLLRRVDVAEELTQRKGSQIGRIVLLSGPRPTQAREGTSGRYKDLDPTGSERSVEDLFITEYASANAIAEHRLGGVLQQIERDDSIDGQVRGGEIARMYRTDSGLEIVVMNGMPVVLEDAVNRPSNEGLPRAPLTFEEYISHFGVESAGISYISSYPHRNRIAIEALRKLIQMDRADDIEIFPQGLMSYPDKVSAGLIAGEVKPMMDLTRSLVLDAGLDPASIPKTETAVNAYLRSIGE